MKLATARRTEMKTGRDKDLSVQGDETKYYLFDIYLKEGKKFMEEKEYTNALKSLNKALELRPGANSALLVRSRCHLDTGRRLRALRDADSILDHNPSNPEALYAKAETLFESGNYELSLIYFHRGLKQEPQSKHFRSGIEKAESAVLKFGGKTSGTRLRAADKVGLRKHRKVVSQKRMRDFAPGVPPLSDRMGHRSWRNTTDDFRSGYSNPLTRITKKPGLSYFRSFQTQSEGCPSELSSLYEAPHTSVDEKALQQILGELNNDRKYLHRLHDSPVLSKAAEADLAGDGINYLQKCGAYWNSLGPLPPPQPTRRKYRSTPRNTPRYDVTETPSASFRFKKMEEPVATAADLNFHFASYKQEDVTSVGMETDIDEPGRSVSMLLSEPTMTSFREKPVVTHTRNTSMSIVSQLEAIRTLYTRGNWYECQSKAEACLNNIETTDENEIPDKMSIKATLHSYLGNVAASIGDYSKAEHHHLQDLYIGDNDECPDAVSRALGNLGRIYTTTRKFNQALDVLARKAPMCSDPEEVAWVFLEIGTCFLALGHYDYARDCGKKVLTASGRPDLELQRFQAHLLLGSSYERLKTFEKAIRSYKAALLLAKERGDHMAESAITRVMRKLEKKMAFKGQQSPKRKDLEVDYPESIISDTQYGTLSTRTAASSVNTNYQWLSERAVDTDRTYGNAPKSGFEVDRATVFSVMKRLRDESASFSSYPLSDSQELEESDFASSMDECEEIPVLRRSSNANHSNSISRGKSVFRKKSISFKLVDEEISLYENDEHRLASSRSFNSINLISRKERAALKLKERSMKIKYQSVENDWSPPRINPKRHIANLNEFKVKDPILVPDKSENEFRKSGQFINDQVHSTKATENVVASGIAEGMEEDYCYESSEPDDDDGDSHPVELFIEGDIMDHMTVADDAEENSFVIDDADGHVDFLYPHDALSFSCPFEKEFSIHQEDLLMMTTEEDFQETRLEMTEDPWERLNDECPKMVSGTDSSQEETDIASSLEIRESPSSSGYVQSSPELHRKEGIHNDSEENSEDSTESCHTSKVKSPMSSKESARSAENAITESGSYSKDDKKSEIKSIQSQQIENSSSIAQLPKQPFLGKANDSCLEKENSEELQQADDSEKSVHGKQQLFKSKYHDILYAKKSPRFDQKETQKVTNAEKVETHTSPEPLFKSKYHSRFAKESPRLENDDYKGRLSKPSEQQSTPREPLFKSKYHELFKTKSEEKLTPVKYEPQLYLALKKVKGQSKKMESPSEKTEHISNSIHTDSSNEKMTMHRSTIKSLVPEMDLSVITTEENSGASPKSTNNSGRTIVTKERLLPALKENPLNRSLRSPRERGSSKWYVLKEKLKFGSKINKTRVSQLSKQNQKENDFSSKESKFESNSDNLRRERKYVDHWLKLKGVSPRYPEPENSNVGLNDIPSFIQKNKILFRLSKGNDKIVFTPLGHAELEKKWKVIYMRIRKGDKTFTVPVATDASELLENTDTGGATKAGKQLNTKQRRAPNRKLYPVKLDQKQKFKLRMNRRNLRTVQEDTEYKISPRTPVSKISHKGYLTQNTKHSKSKDKHPPSRTLDHGPVQGKQKSISLRIRNQHPHDAKSPTDDAGAVSTVIRVPHGQEVVYRQEDRDGKTVLVPVVKEAAHKMVLVKVRQNDKTFILPFIVGKS